MDQSPLDAIASAQLRVARPTRQLAILVAFYKRVLGFKELGRFEDHDGFDGVMLGHSGNGYHLEFTQCADHASISKPDPDDLLIFYIPSRQRWLDIVTWIEGCGVLPVRSANPYWDRNGRSYADPDGRRFVIQNSSWH